MRKKNAVGCPTRQRQRTNVDVDGIQDRISTVTKRLAHAFLKGQSDYAPVLGDVMAGQLGQFVVALDEMNLLGEVELPLRSVQQNLAGMIQVG